MVSAGFIAVHLMFLSGGVFFVAPGFAEYCHQARVQERCFRFEAAIRHSWYRF